MFKQDKWLGYIVSSFPMVYYLFRTFEHTNCSLYTPILRKSYYFPIFTSFISDDCSPSDTFPAISLGFFHTAERKKGLFSFLFYIWFYQCYVPGMFIPDPMIRIFFVSSRNEYYLWFSLIKWCQSKHFLKINLYSCQYWYENYAKSLRKKLPRDTKIDDFCTVDLKSTTKSSTRVRSLSLRPRVDISWDFA